MSLTGNEVEDSSVPPGSVGEHSESPTASSTNGTQGSDISGRASNGSQSSDLGKQDETNRLGVIDIPLGDMVDFWAKFVEEPNLLGATILTELNKLKTLMAQKKTYFWNSLARMELSDSTLGLFFSTGKPSLWVIRQLERGRPEP